MGHFAFSAAFLKQRMVVGTQASDRGREQETFDLNHH
jgi:hypothetical protein